MNNWISHYEAIWLFWILAGELAVGLATLTILVVEYIYDKKYNETKHKRKTTRNKVKVEIDKEGNARIVEAPKGMDIAIEHMGNHK